MATVTGRISSPASLAMPDAVVVLRRFESSASSGELLSDGYTTVSLNVDATFSIQLSTGRFLMTIQDTSDVIDITVPSAIGTFSISDILTFPVIGSVDQSEIDMGHL